MFKQLADFILGQPGSYIHTIIIEKQLILFIIRP